MIDDAISWWKLDEIVAGPVVDTQGHNAGTNYGAIINQAGKFGKCYAFDGSDDYILVPHNADITFTSGDFTLCFWLKIIDVGGTVIASKGIYGATGWYIQSSGSHGFSFSYKDASGPQTVGTVNNVFTDNQWFLFTIVRSGTSIKFYVNGVDKTSGTPTMTNIITSTRDLHLMCYDDTTMNTTGLLDETRIYNRALSQAEINGLYHNNQLNFTLTVVAGPHGAVEADPDQETYLYGDEVHISAWSLDAYEGESGGDNCDFKQWDDANTDNPRTITVTGDFIYTAIFKWRRAYVQTFGEVGKLGKAYKESFGTAKPDLVDPTDAKTWEDNRNTYPETWGDEE